MMATVDWGQIRVRQIWNFFSSLFIFCFARVVKMVIYMMHGCFGYALQVGTAELLMGALEIGEYELKW